MNSNPYRPGAGQTPPWLAGRDQEQQQFKRLLQQDIVLENLIITGLRGIGKTVLLESLKPIAVNDDWLWTGEDFSQSLGLSEDRLVMRLLTDIAYLTSSVVVEQKHGVGFLSEDTPTYLNYPTLKSLYDQTPGLPADKLKRVFEVTWQVVSAVNKRGIVFAYDEAQTLSDNPSASQYPLSLLLDVFQAIQRKGIRFMLVLTGLPTLQPNLVATRTYSERLFHIFVLRQLSDGESKEAILKPLLDDQGKSKPGMVMFDDTAIETIVRESGGYPYFIQYLCRETYDVYQQQITNGETPSVPVEAIMNRLDNNFFYGRWAKSTDRERELMIIIAKAGLKEFTPTQAMTASKDSDFRSFSLSQIAGYLKKLIDEGLIYKDKRGVYSFAVPLMEGYILRNLSESNS